MTAPHASTTPTEVGLDTDFDGLRAAADQIIKHYKGGIYLHDTFGNHPILGKVHGFTPTKWDTRMLDLADHVACWSRDPSTQVGVVIVRPDNTVASMGFNGFPRGVNDDPARYEDKAIKYPMVVHAEANAITTAREPLHGYTLYGNLAPCCDCTGLLIQAGIKRVVTPPPTLEVFERWKDSMDMAATMMQEAGVMYLWATS